MAGTPETCETRLEKCDVTIHKLQKVNELQKQIIEDQDKVIETQKKELSRAWDPFKAIGLGLLIGLVGGIYLERR